MGRYGLLPRVNNFRKLTYTLGPEASAHKEAKLPSMELRKWWRQLCLLSQSVRAPSYVGRHSAPEQACSIWISFPCGLDLDRSVVVHVTGVRLSPVPPHSGALLGRPDPLEPRHPVSSKSVRG